MRLFYLDRATDVSGISGTGKVAEGVVFGDGQCVIRWLGKVHSIAVYPTMQDLMKVHGHDGATTVVFEDGL